MEERIERQLGELCSLPPEEVEARLYRQQRRRVRQGEMIRVTRAITQRMSFPRNVPGARTVDLTEDHLYETAADELGGSIVIRVPLPIQNHPSQQSDGLRIGERSSLAEEPPLPCSLERLIVIHNGNE